MATYDNAYIIRYIEGDLSPEERQAFEAALQTDASLAASLALYREVETVLQQRLPADAGVTALRERMEELKKVHFAKGPKRIPVIRYITGFAAAAAIIVFAIVLWPRGDYMDRFGGTQMVSSAERGDGADSLLQQAAVYFNKGQFDRALPLLQKSVAADSSNTMALFYRGVAQLHMHAIDAGRQDLERVYNTESIFRYEAAFYTALSYAQQKNAIAAREWLDKIPAGTPVSEKAAELRKKVE